MDKEEKGKKVVMDMGYSLQNHMYVQNTQELGDFVATTCVSWDGTTFECERSIPTVPRDASQGSCLNASVEIEGKRAIN